MTQKPLPDYAHVVLVPIANPTTAPELIRLAEAFVKRDGGRVIALAVTRSDGDAEDSRDRLAQLEQIVAQFRGDGDDEEEPDTEVETVDPDLEDVPAPELPILEEDQPDVDIDFVTHTANSISRGILDMARENGAELIILGVQKPQQNQVAIGSITESVMSAASMDVLVYRHSDFPAFNRILVPVDGSPASRMAVRVGILFGNAYQGCPVEAMHVQGSERPEFDGRARIEQALSNVPGSGIVKRSLVTAQSVADAILSRVDENHLIVMGFSRRKDLEVWLDGESPTRKILDQAPGPVLLAVRSTQTVTARARLQRRIISWVRPTLTDVEQQQIVWTANDNASLTLDYVVLMIVSATLASLGLLLNSAAVIIGAMLVAPLMSPLTAFATGLSTARLDIVRRAFVTAFAGFVIASLVSMLIGVLVPLQSATPEMMSRVSPSLLDAFVALASGVAGAYAAARRDIPAALAGVAIAAALVPPICTFGLQVAFGNATLGLGAALLFLTNIVSIVVIATIVFVWLGLYPRRMDRDDLMAYVPVVITVLLSLPLVIALLNTSQQAQDESQIASAVNDVFVGFEVSDVLVTGEDPANVQATILSPYVLPAEAAAAAEQLLESLLEQEITLRLVVQQVVEGEEHQAEGLPDASPFTVDEFGIVQPPPEPTPSEVD
jgi:uncharacterized hydrophobic protein (TIGR00271 family)